MIIVELAALVLLFDSIFSEDTPVGSIIYTIKGQDPDPNAVLTFGVSGEGADVVEIINNRQTPREAQVRLIRKLDRETQASHLIRLTLTDGIISKPIVQDSTLYVGDENDETVRKKSGREISQTQSPMSRNVCLVD